MRDVKKLNFWQLILYVVVVDCGNPEALKNGKVMLPSNATYYGVLALYTCDDNFELHGVSRSLCQENGTWSSSIPHCKGK